MAWRFALMIDPAAAGDDRADYDDTFTVPVVQACAG